jgi:CDP-diacylglycerol--serine O-phosphatidyltransferase
MLHGQSRQAIVEASMNEDAKQTNPARDPKEPRPLFPLRRRAEDADADAPLRRRRGIYLLPNLFTTAAMFAGFYGIVAAINDRFETAAVSIFAAMILDGMDGRVARMTNTQSAFGAEYDSLSDMVSFGLAPALISYLWALHSFGKTGWVVAFLYATMAALRLARFNTQVGKADKKYFQGLPSPSAAALVAGIVWVATDNGMRVSVVMGALTMALTAAAGLLMVSNIRYHSFKDLDLHGRVRFFSILLIVLAFVFVSINPPLHIFLGFLAYAASGPVLTLLLLRKRRAARRAAGTDSAR